MAINSYKILGQANPTTANTEVVLYTVPSSFMALGSVLSICNQGSTTGTCKVAVRPAGTSSTPQTFLLFDAAINPKDSLMLTLGLSLATTDVIGVWASTTSFSFVLSGSEVIIDTTNVQSVFNIATSGSVGMVRPDNTSITISSNGVISLVPGGSFTQATSSNFGAVRPDNTSILVTSGVLSASIANASVLGITRPDNTSLLINSGVLSVRSVFTGKQTFQGSTTAIGIKLISAIEGIVISSIATTGTINYDLTTQAMLYHTSSTSGNWTVNFRGNATNSLDSLLSVGESITAVFLATNGTTPRYNTSVTVDSSVVVPKWQNGVAPTTGNTSSTDIYSYVLIKTAAATFSCFATLTKFA
jgi:hypothetical protein